MRKRNFRILRLPNRTSQPNTGGTAADVGDFCCEATEEPLASKNAFALLRHSSATSPLATSPLVASPSAVSPPTISLPTTFPPTAPPIVVSPLAVPPSVVSPTIHDELLARLVDRCTAVLEALRKVISMKFVETPLERLNDTDIKRNWYNACANASRICSTLLQAIEMSLHSIEQKDLQRVGMCAVSPGIPFESHDGELNLTPTQRSAAVESRCKRSSKDANSFFSPLLEPMTGTREIQATDTLMFPRAYTAVDSWHAAASSDTSEIAPRRLTPHLIVRSWSGDDIIKPQRTVSGIDTAHNTADNMGEDTRLQGTLDGNSHSFRCRVQVEESSLSAVIQALQLVPTLPYDLAAALPYSNAFLALHIESLLKLLVSLVPRYCCLARAVASQPLAEERDMHPVECCAPGVFLKALFSSSEPFYVPLIKNNLEGRVAIPGATIACSTTVYLITILNAAVLPNSPPLFAGQEDFKAACTEIVRFIVKELQFPLILMGLLRSNVDVLLRNAIFETFQATEPFLGSVLAEDKRYQEHFFNVLEDSLLFSSDDESQRAGLLLLFGVLTHDTTVLSNYTADLTRCVPIVTLFLLNYFMTNNMVEVYHILKLIVANPRKPEAIQKFLRVNRDALLLRLAWLKRVDKIERWLSDEDYKAVSATLLIL